VTQAGKPAGVAHPVRPKLAAQKTPAVLLAEAIGLLAHESEAEGHVVKLRAAQVLDAVTAALARPDAAKALEKAAAAIHAALGTKPTIADPEQKGPVADQVRTLLIGMLGKRRPLDATDPELVAKLLDVAARMVVGGGRIFKAGTHEQRVARWTGPIERLFLFKHFETLRMRCTEVIKACARADGYHGRLNDLFR